MITTAEEYFRHLHLIQNQNFPQHAYLLPSDETIYNIDLNKRIIEAPEILSAKTDHRAETIYFKVDRYYETVDLTNTVCLIQYVNKNAAKENGAKDGGYAYIVPFYDTSYFSEENKILIPWEINGPATKEAGPVEFAVKFYLLDEEGKEYLYNINTQPATSEILYAMNVITDENENFLVPESQLELVFQQIQDIRERLPLYWVEV